MSMFLPCLFFCFLGFSANFLKILSCLLCFLGCSVLLVFYSFLSYLVCFLVLSFLLACLAFSAFLACLLLSCLFCLLNTYFSTSFLSVLLSWLFCVLVWLFCFLGFSSFLSFLLSCLVASSTVLPAALQLCALPHKSQGRPQGWGAGAVNCPRLARRIHAFTVKPRPSAALFVGPSSSTLP